MLFGQVIEVNLREDWQDITCLKRLLPLLVEERKCDQSW
jgi:hypothetical protein